MEILSSNGLIIAGIAVSVVVAVFLLSAGKARLARHPYQRQASLFTPDDRVFFQALKNAVGESYEIFGKIRVADIVVPKKGTSRTEARLAFSPIAGRHFDFVLCEKPNMAVACVIQLTDKTNPARMPEAGNPIKAVCESVALPHVSVQIQAEYPAHELKERLRLAMSREPFYMVETDGRREPRISNLDDIQF